MLTITIAEKDLFNAQRLHSKMSGAQTALFILATLLVGFYLYDEVGVRPAVLIFGAGGGIIGLLGYYIFLKYRCAKIYRQQKSLRIPYELSWDNDSVYMKNEMGEGRIKWSDFIKYKQNESLILLYHSDVLFNVVPKSAFNSAQQVDEFLGHLGKI